MMIITGTIVELTDDVDDSDHDLKTNWPHNELFNG